ncbi:hypothetical protein B842_03215 [Corynebacterium humireducens NBRC 106098 = DSM 45392]|uniref:Uncharacterized protein n=1 Tax=Corynebacterium humireducens NBRC 106098 = DSM 45392 TaxID=1223515 RepID=A0A0B5D1J4_9CORY|nr:hypothetical protein [Corynebacterium humireducens]AJE32496.1 hypothetical protein B842_03215 [Corynebacterium humireducens NBRC 106098 = DSM 45392]
MQVEPEHVLSFLGVVIAAWLSYASARVAARAKVQTVTQEKEDGKIQTAVDRVLGVMEEGFAARDQKIGRLDGRLQALERKDDAWRRHVLDWREAHPDRSRWPTPPMEVRADLPD